ncbi:hypothetical protein [Fusobacterium perfoetens]|uniref:hypothetical protein n=1 Tax=Fusobacterium perfoetens TaxID=852 RepID=UPI0004846844|nr:hypothetical protein [Fusobacterium perfoetens]MCI6151852.1 hypothetical protein [Fusobacterium perfoetens]MDY3236787.1 hypothetical protein [Fusobacterium perfoetens]
MTEILSLNGLNKKELVLKLTDFYKKNENSRNILLKNVIHTTNKRAFFTIDENCNIKRKSGNFVLASTIFVDEDEKFLEYLVDNIDLSDQDKYNEISIKRMSNEKIEVLEKNSIKLIVNGKLEFGIKYLYELYKRDEERFFKFLSKIALMDNIDFNKTLYVYSLKKYFEKYGYSLEIFYYVISYIIKARFDLYEFENIKVFEDIRKEELKNRFLNNIEKYKNLEGLKLLSYLKTLLEYDFENEEKYINILKIRMDKLENKNSLEKLDSITEEIFNKLIK